MNLLASKSKINYLLTRCYQQSTYVTSQRKSSTIQKILIQQKAKVVRKVTIDCLKNQMKENNR